MNTQETALVAADDKIDTSTVQLLELVDQYEQLCNDKLRVHFADGFFMLGRANYNSGLVKKYGVESLDLRPHDANVTIAVGEQLKVVREQKAETSKERDENKKSSSGEPHEKKEPNEQTLRNRTQKRSNVEDEDKGTTATDPILEKATFNPLHQFGGLVPYQLRQSQQHFLAAIDSAVDRYNLAQKIDKLVDDIESQM